MICREFRDDRDRDRHHQFLPILAGAGLAPSIISLTDRERCLKECVPLDAWLRTANAGEVLAMRSLVLELIGAMHALGVCHRDLHESNLVLDGGRPLVIDLELACAVDPAWQCYDLYGPSDRIPVADKHVELNDGAHSLHGVWWDSPVAGLSRAFGPLHEPPSVTPTAL